MESFITLSAKLTKLRCI